MEQIRKAMDTVASASYTRQDLSDLISMSDGPVRPLLQAQTYRNGQVVPAIGTVPGKQRIHEWVEQGLVAANGSTAGFAEGGKPAGASLAPVMKQNVMGRFGKTAAVTDEEAATWTHGGAFTLADGEMERLINEALDLDTELRLEETLNEIEWCMVNGDADNNTNASVPPVPSQASGTAIVSQFNGLLQILVANSIAAKSGYAGTANAQYGGATVLDAQAAAYGSSGVMTEQMVRDLAKMVAKQRTKYRPNILLVSEDYAEVANSWHPMQYTTQDAAQPLTGGAEVIKYNTGFGVVDIVPEPQLPTGVAVLTNTNLIKRAPLIELGTEPLARVQTQVERMITCTMSLEVRVQKAHGVICNLA